MRWGGLLLGLALLAVALRTLPIGPWLERLRDHFEALGPWGLGLFVVAYAVLAVLLVPGSVLTLGAGVVYGLAWGTAAVSAGSTAGAAGAFLIARYLARRRVESWAAANPRFAAIDEAVGREGWKIVLLTRLSPVFPYTLLNYFYGLTRVRFGPYVLASWVGMLPGTVLYVYLGVAGGAVAEAASGQAEQAPLKYLFQAVGLLATLGVTLYITRVARAALHGRADIGA
ncbi:MAG: TVP38/TMEM64 family protein [Acidobacteria bacterium]|nr:TVP38/TMEM64 family protein [Acidobacteriota bacterium]